MINSAKNIFSDIPDNFPDEIIETLVSSENVRVEKIISKGHPSPENFWYDQEENEWVVLLKGNAKLLFEEGKLINLTAGDYINIPAHTKHRVSWTGCKSRVCLAYCFL